MDTVWALQATHFTSYQNKTRHQEARLMKQSTFNNTNYTTMIQTDPNTVTMADISANKTTIHSAIVTKHLTNRNNNKILQALPVFHPTSTALKRHMIYPHMRHSEQINLLSLTSSCTHHLQLLVNQNFLYGSKNREQEKFFRIWRVTEALLSKKIYWSTMIGVIRDFYMSIFAEN